MPPANLLILVEESSTRSQNSGAHFKPCQSKGIPNLIAQEGLNDLVWDLNFSKGKSEHLASCLQQWNLLSPGTKVGFIVKGLNVHLTSFLQMVSFAIVMVFLHCLKTLV